MAYLNHLHQHQYHHHGASPYSHHHQQQQQQQQYDQHDQQNYQQHHNNHHQRMMMMDTEEDRMEARAAEELLDSDSRHELLLGIDYLPCPNTVIVGRGKKVAQHAGNVRFRELVKKELTEYSAATTKAHKSSIIVRVLTEIRNKSQYAFVKQNLTTGRWYRVEETAQRITTAQAFRDALKDNYKSSRAFKKLKREEEKNNNKKDKDSEEKAKEKKEKKKAAAAEKKKKAAEQAAAVAAANNSKPPPAPTEAAPPAAAAAVEPSSPAAAATAASFPPRAPKPAGGGGPPPTTAGGGGTGAKKAPGKSLEDLRSILEQSQSALVSGNFSWWDPNAVTAMDTDKKMPPPSAIPNASVSSCSSLLWSNHSNKWSNHSRQNHHKDPFGSSRDHYSRDYNNNNNSKDYKDYKDSYSRDYYNNRDNNTKSRSRDMSGHGSIKWSNHSIRTMSNHSIMTISGHSTRSNSTFNGLVSKYAPSSSADMVGNPFEPTPIPACVQEDGAMDMDMEDLDESNTGRGGTDEGAGVPKTYVPRTSTSFDEGIAMGLGNLSDHSLMSNMSSMHSVKGFTAEEIFADSSMHGSNRDHHHHHGSGAGRGSGSSHHQRNPYPPQGRYRHMGFAMSA